MLILALLVFGCANVTNNVTNNDDVIVDEIIITDDAEIKAGAVTKETSCGIQIRAPKAAVNQYEKYHSPLKWDNVEWEKLCTIWETQREVFFKAGVDISKTTPDNVKVVIKPWRLIELPDYGTKPRILVPGDGYAQAYFLPGTMIIAMSLSLDSGQGPNAMCISPFRHEANHAILKKAKHKCWALGERGSTECSKWDLKSTCP
jgi:hypothetical protein